MRKRLLQALCAVITLCAVACTKAPAPETPPRTDTVLICDMSQHTWFGEIFSEKDETEWDAMGRFSVRVTGLCVPVTVEMEGGNVLSVSAFGYTETVDLPWSQGDVNASINGTDTAVVVHDFEDWDSRSWVFTSGGCYAFLPENGVCTVVRVDEYGALRYTRATNDYNTSFNQWENAPLDCCVSRNDFVCETGYVELVNNTPVLRQETVCTVSDLYDLDALFAAAKQEGYYKEYHTADELLAANRQRQKSASSEE